jgi:hypothetical protein
LPGRLGLGDYDWLVFLGQDLEFLLVFSDVHRQLLTLAGSLSAAAASSARPTLG